MTFFFTIGVWVDLGVATGSGVGVVVGCGVFGEKEKPDKGFGLSCSDNFAVPLVVLRVSFCRSDETLVGILANNIGINISAPIPARRFFIYIVYRGSGLLYRVFGIKKRIVCFQSENIVPQFFELFDNILHNAYDKGTL